MKKKIVQVLKLGLNIKKLQVFSPHKANKLTPFSILFILGFFIVINGILLYVPSIRFDFSPNKVFTLSQSSKKIIKNLSKTTTFNIYVSSNLPARLLPIKSDVLTFLKEYERYSSGKIQIKIHDPKLDTKAQEVVEAEGIPPLQFSEVENNQYKVTASYFGMIISSGKTKQVIPQLIQTENLEYNVTLALYKNTVKKLPSVHLVDLPYNPSTQQDDFSLLREVLANQFETLSLESSDYKTSLKKASKNDVFLVFVDGVQKYSAKQKKLFSDILSQGNNVIALINTLNVDGGLTTATIAEHGLNTVFSPYGIVIQKDLILSDRAPTLTFNTSQGYLLLKYPPWIKTNSFAQDRSEFTNVSELVFPWTSSLKLIGQKATPLIFSDKDAWSVIKSFNISPTITFGPSKNSSRGPFVLAAEATLRNKGKLLVIPSARFVQNEFLARGSSNIEFLLNSISQYASSGDLAGIRARSVDIRSLKPIDAQYKDVIKYTTILILPMLFLLFGLYRLIKKG